MQSLPLIDPAEAGLTPRAGEQLAAFAAAGLEEGLFERGCYCILKGGGVAAAGAAGPAGFAETVFDLASLTKPIVTATSVLLLASRGECHLGDEVERFLAASATGSLAGITLRHLLTHTSGLPAWRKYHSRGLDRDQVLAEVRSAVRERPTGARFVYSDLGFILLGLAVEQAAGQPLERFAREQILEPLGMSRSGYLPPGEWAEAIAPTRCPDRQRVLTGEVHDGNCDAMGGVAGHAGLFGTAADVARYAAMLLNGGEIQGRRVLPPLAVKAMGTQQLAPDVGGSGLGWFMAPNVMLPAGDFLPPDAFGHTGFTGTSLVVCPSLDLGILLLTNRVHQEREAAGFLRFRRRFHNLVAGLIER